MELGYVSESFPDCVDAEPPTLQDVALLSLLDRETEPGIKVEAEGKLRSEHDDEDDSIEWIDEAFGALTLL